jgi:threonine synthase
MGSLTQSGSFNIASPALAKIREKFSAARADEDETAATMRTLRRESGYVADPHTAVALAVAEKETPPGGVPMIVLSTAHPAKFPDAVKAACGVWPELPDWLSGLNTAEERITHLPADQGELERFVLSVSRAVKDEGNAA